MAVQFLEEIYQYANTITKMKMAVECIRKYQTKLSETMFESLMIEMYKLCKKCVETGFAEAEELLFQVDSLNSMEDEILLGDILENIIVPMMERWIQSVSQICQKIDEKYMLESTASGFLTIKNVEKNRYLHSNNNPMEEAGKLVEYLYDSDKKMYAVYGCGLGYHVYFLYLMSDKDIYIKVYENDNSIIEYAKKYGVLDWIPSDRLEIITDRCVDLFLENINNDNIGIIIHRPSVFQIESDIEIKEILDLFENLNAFDRTNSEIKSCGNATYNILSENIYSLKDISEKSHIKDIVLQIHKTDIDNFLEYLIKYERNIYKYIYILSFLYEITNKEIILQMMLDSFGKESLDILDVENIRQYVNYIIFVNPNIHMPYIQERKINKLLCDKWKKEWGNWFKYIPYENRKKNTILLMTDSFVSKGHAPTSIVMNTCSVLKSIGLNVYLLVNITGYDEKKNSEIFFNPFTMRVNEKLYSAGIFELEGMQIPFMQVNYTQNTKEVIERIKNFIVKIRPEFIWHIGGQSFIADIIGESSTYISTKCTDGYAASEADILVSYTASDSDYVKESLSYIGKRKQRTFKISLPITRNYELSNVNYTRKQFDLPENKFLICFVGNRLNYEIDTNYRKWMKELLKESEKFFFVTIGQAIEESEFIGKIKQLGEQSNLSNVIQLCDVFVNPPRQGGGGSSIAALAAGIPVLTLPDCDVAAAVPNEFIVDNLEKMKEKIIRYHNEQECYLEMSKIARSHFERKMNQSKKEDIQDEFIHMIECIRKEE